MREPRLPERTRLLRPGLFEQEDSGPLPGEAFKLYVGLSTCSDDEGWLLWRPANIAARLYPYLPIVKRTKLLERERERLEAAGLLMVYECRCAQLLHLHRDFRIGGGNHTQAVVAYHASHLSTAEYVQVGTSPAPDWVRSRIC